MQQRILPGRGSGGLSWTWPAGTALPSAASFSSAGFNPSKPSMMPCMVSCGVWPFFTALETSTTPRSVIRPGVISLWAADWNRTSFTNFFLPWEHDPEKWGPVFGQDHAQMCLARNTAHRPQPGQPMPSTGPPRISGLWRRGQIAFPPPAAISSPPDGASEKPPSIQGEGTMAVIKVTDIAYARLRAPDLDLQSEFLENFGLVQSAKTNNAIYYRGTDPVHHLHITEKGEPKFVGIAYHAASEDDLKTLAKVPGASGIENLDEPGGGKRVRVTESNRYQIEVF